MSLKTVILIVIVGVVSIKCQQTEPYTFPDDFGFCDVESANAPECLRETIQNWSRMLGTRGIDHPIRFTIEPMNVPYWILHVNRNFLNNTEYLWDSTFTGFSNVTVTSASYDPQTLTLVYTAYYPNLLETGRYRMSGIIAFDDGTTDSFFGNGPYDKQMTGMNLTHRITFVPAPRDHGIEHLQISSYSIESCSIGDASLHWYNLYNGDGARTNRAVNRLLQNIVAMGGALEGTFRQMIVEMFRQYTEELISSVPRSEIRRHFFSHP